MTKQYTEAELLRIYKGRYIETHPTYDYANHVWMYEVRSVSKKIRENHNFPEDEIIAS